MVSNKQLAFISFKDTQEFTNGYYEIVEQTQNYIKVKTSKNIVTIPLSEIKKIKEERE